jgi:hypothetical protein
MPDPISGAIGAVTSIGGSLVGGSASKKASKQQAKAIGEAVKSIEGTQEELRDISGLTQDDLREIFAPYMGAGGTALNEMMTALGLSDQKSQMRYVQGIERSPMFQQLARQGERAMLQRASATGGVRGGNIQGALAQFRPSLLNQFLDERYARLGGLAQGGLQAGTSLGSGILGSSNQLMASLGGTGSAIAELIAGRGAAQAGGTLAQGQAWGDALGAFGFGLGGLFGGSKKAGTSGGSGRGAATDMGTIAMGGGFD